MAGIVTDPRQAHTLSEFLSTMADSSVITYPKLSFIEKRNGIEFPVKNILNDYLFELKNVAKVVVLNESEQNKYFYRPKILSSDIYDTTELWYVILMINDMCDVKEFTNSSIKMLHKDDMAKYIPMIYDAERAAIETYNGLHS